MSVKCIPIAILVVLAMAGQARSQECRWDGTYPKTSTGTNGIVIKGQVIIPKDGSIASLTCRIWRDDKLVKEFNVSVDKDTGKFADFMGWQEVDLDTGVSMVTFNVIVEAAFADKTRAITKPRTAVSK